MGQIPFYGRSEDERSALVRAAVQEKRTLLERWANLTEQEASGWSARAAMAAKWLAGFDSVADFGAGPMHLERYLRPGQSYVPLDVVARDQRTIVCDFNTTSPPETGAEAAACLGLLEYLFDPLAFLRALRQHYRHAVVSYCVSDSPDAPENRLQHAWVNAFSTAELRVQLEEAGWRILDEAPVDDLQRLWRLGE